jgi:hypothetical protein
LMRNRPSFYMILENSFKASNCSINQIFFLEKV